VRDFTPSPEAVPPRRLGLALHPRRDVADALATLVAWAAEEGVALVGPPDDRLPDGIERRNDPDAVPEGCELVLALGGDGTMLGAMRLAAPLGIPVLGANMGRLGYLTEVDGEHLRGALDALSRGSFAVEERFALRATWEEDGAARERVAYNDVVLSREPGHGQAALGLSVDGQLLVRYASDGVIAATPGGSTGYSFAAGGPIVSPQTRATIVTPDSPHGLFNRAVVLGHDERLGVEVLGRSAPVALEVDGRLMAGLESGAAVTVSPADTPALVVRLGSAGFAERARRKLGITDPANLADYDLAGHQR
jgi:NAD+ kinase